MKPLGSQLIAEFMNCPGAVLNDKAALEEIVATGIEACGLTLISVSSHKFDPVGVTTVAIIGESHVVVHTYPEARHASIDIFTCSNGSDSQDDLLAYLQRRLAPSTVRVARMNRGNPLEVGQTDWITSASASGYETRYHVERLLLSKRSRYQQIDIIENDNFGRMLFLDKDLQIAEHDAPTYNRALVTPVVAGRRKLGRVAILGGGDGGVLSELLEHEPEAVMLVDIDGDVIEASRKYLPTICRGAFDHPNVEVCIEDANLFLDRERDFDAIIYDLTMYPEALTCGEREEFIGGIFDKIGRALKPGGVVTAQCCSQFDDGTLDLLTGILTPRFDNLSYNTVHIPSFCESWVFAAADARAALARRSAAPPEGPKARLAAN